jgi:integrase
VGLRLTKRNRIYQVTGTAFGRSIRRSAGTTSKQKAEAIRASLEKEAFEAFLLGRKRSLRFEEAVQLYLKAGGSQRGIAALVSAIGSMRLVQIDQELVIDLAERLHPGTSPGTRICFVYTPITAVMSHAVRIGRCEPFIIRKPKVRPKAPNWLTPPQAEDWIGALDGSPELRSLVIFLLGTGCRVGEAIRLRWSDVTPGEDRFVLWRTKNGYARGGDIPPRVRAALPPRTEDPNSLVFLTVRGRPWTSHKLVNARLRYVKKVRDAARLRGATDLPPLWHAHCHAFRHTWASWAYACTLDFVYLMNQGGWRSAEMVMRYTHFGSAELSREVLERGWTFSRRELVFPTETAV